MAGAAAAQRDRRVRRRRHHPERVVAAAVSDVHTRSCARWPGSRRALRPRVARFVVPFDLLRCMELVELCVPSSRRTWTSSEALIAPVAIGAGGGAAADWHHVRAAAYPATPTKSARSCRARAALRRRSASRNGLFCSICRWRLRAWQAPRSWSRGRCIVPSLAAFQAQFFTDPTNIYLARLPPRRDVRRRDRAADIRARRVRRTRPCGTGGGPGRGAVSGGAADQRPRLALREARCPSR